MITTCVLTVKDLGLAPVKHSDKNFHCFTWEKDQAQQGQTAHFSTHTYLSATYVQL